MPIISNHSIINIRIREIEKTDIRQSRESIVSSLQVTSSPIIEISGKIDHMGCILSCNLAFQSLFSMQREKLIGQQVDILMPSIFIEKHNQIIYDSHYKKYGNDDEEQITSIYGLHSSGHVFPAKIKMYNYQNVNEERVLLGKFDLDDLSLSHEESLLLVNTEGRIMNCSIGITCNQGANYYLGLTPSLLKEYSINIQTMLSKFPNKSQVNDEILGKDIEMEMKYLCMAPKIVEKHMVMCEIYKNQKSQYLVSLPDAHSEPFSQTLPILDASDNTTLAKCRFLKLDYIKMGFIGYSVKISLKKPLISEPLIKEQNVCQFNIIPSKAVFIATIQSDQDEERKTDSVYSSDNELLVNMPTDNSFFSRIQRSMITNGINPMIYDSWINKVLMFIR